MNNSNFQSDVENSSDHTHLAGKMCARDFGAHRLNSRIKILLILSNFYKEEMLSWPEVIGVFHEGLPKLGYEVEWIMPIDVRLQEEYSIKRSGNIVINLLPLLRSENKLGLLFSIIVYQIRLFFFVLRKLRNEVVDLIIVRDDALAGVNLIILSFIFRIKFGYNLSFPIDEGAKDAIKARAISYYQYVYYKIHDLFIKKIILRKANLVLPISKRMENQIKNNVSKNALIFPLPLGVSPQIFKSGKSSNISREQLKIKPREVIFVYIGSVSKLRGLDVLVKSFRKVLQVEKDARLLIVGDGDALSYLKALSRELAISESIIFMGRVPHSSVPDILDLSDVAVSVIKPLACFYVSSPCKLFEYMISKKPVIANEEIPEHYEIVTMSRCGVLTKYEENSLAKAMVDMIYLKRNESRRLEELGRNGFTWVMENRNYDHIASMLSSKIRTLINGEGMSC